MNHSKFEYGEEKHDYHMRIVNKKHFILLAFSTVCALVTVILVIVIVSAASGLIHLYKQEECKSKMSTTISEDAFGTSGGQQVKRFKLKNAKSKMEVEIITYGGTITVIKVPDKTRNLIDVSLGYDSLLGYEGRDNPYFGALVGRVANRIGKGRFTYNGQDYQLTLNDGPNHLHGGTVGWNKAVWLACVNSGSLILSHTSLDGDQGYPGIVTTNVTFDLTDEGELRLQYKAMTQGKATPINLTTHPYFNLAGEGSSNIGNHEVTIYADRYLPVNDQFIPTGEIAKVNGTAFDLRQAKLLDAAINNVPGGGYNHNYCINGPTGKRKAAKVKNQDTGIVMEVYTDQPGVQFYTGDYLNILNGKHGHTYGPQSAFCLETQNYPDAVNHANFPDPFLVPGSDYEHTVWYKFSTE